MKRRGARRRQPTHSHNPIRPRAPPHRRGPPFACSPIRAIVIGIVCEDPDPAGIVSFSVRRDATLTSEDHVAIVLGPFRDGRSGYVFAVNPSGARYDGLINPGGETDNPDWDGIWEAATARTRTGGAPRSGFPFRPSASIPACASGTSTSSEGFSGRSKPIAGRPPRGSIRSRKRAAPGCSPDLPEFDLGLGSRSGRR